MSSLATFNARVDNIIKDTATHLASGEIDDHIGAAIDIYSQDRPLKKVKEYTGDGNYDYDLPDDWIDNFSVIVDDIEYPTGSQDPSYLQYNEWILRQTASTTQLRFLTVTPSASQGFNIKYTTVHVIGDSSTVYTHDEEPFSMLAASLCLRALANRYAQSSDSTIAADVVTYRTKPDIYASRAKDLVEIYKNHIITTSPQKPSVFVKEFDTTYPWGGRRLTHNPDHR